MRVLILMSIWLAVLPGQAQESHSLKLTPMDIRTDSEDFYLPGIGQLETDGKHIYLREANLTEILVLDQSGTLVHSIGGKGGHPSEFGSVGVLALGIDGDWLWAIDTERKRVRGFLEGDFQFSFLLDSFNPLFAMPTSNVFAASSSQVVVPAHPQTGHLAAVYDYSGTLVRFAGELLPFGGDLSMAIPGINDSFWLRDGERWLSIHKYFPLITVYSQDFEVLRELRIAGAIIDPLHEKIQAFKADKHMKTAPPLFTDAKLFGGQLFLMSSGHLHQVELSKGKVLSITRFRGEGPGFAQVTRPWVTMFFFVILDNGTAVLAHPAMPWGHDLWTARLPFLAANGTVRSE